MAIQKIGIQLPAVAAMPVGGPALPTPVDISVDDIWLE
jgi:hypothetical protein